MWLGYVPATHTTPLPPWAWRLPAPTLVFSGLGPSGADLSIPEASPKYRDPLRPLICFRTKGHHLQRCPFKAPALSAIHSPAWPFEAFPTGQVTICPTRGVCGYFLYSCHLLLWSGILGALLQWRVGHLVLASSPGATLRAISLPCSSEQE